MKRQALLAGVFSAMFCTMAAAEAPLAGHLPADTAVYVGWAGRSLVFDGSATGQLLQDPSVAGLLKAAGKMIDTKMPSGSKQAIFRDAWAIAGIAWQHPIAIGARPLPKEANPSKAPFEAAILVDLSQDRQEFQRRLDTILASLGEDVKFTEKAEGGMSYRIAVVEEETICLGYKGDLFFATVGEGLARDILLLAPPKSLAANQRFQNDRREVAGDDEQLCFFVDVSGLLARFMPATAPAAGEAQTQPATPRTVLEALGLAKATTLVGSVRVVDHGMHTKVRLLTPAPHRGLLLPLAGGEINPADLGGIPDDADFFAAGKVSLETLYAELLRVIGQIGGERDEAEFKEQVARLESRMGASFSQDIFPTLGDSWVFSMASSQGGFGTGSLLRVSLKDPQKLSDAVAKIKQSLPPPAPQTQPATDEAFAPSRPAFALAMHRASTSRGDIDFLTFGEINPVSPAWMIQKDQLLFALWPQVIQTTLDNAANMKPLVQQAEFQKLYGHLHGKPSMLYYVNTPRIVRLCYPSMLVLGSMGGGYLMHQTGGGETVLVPPPLSTLERYFGPEIGGISADEKGITFEAYGSQPSGLLAVPVLAGAAIPAIIQARHHAETTLAGIEANQLSVALRMYAIDNNGQLPGSLSDEKFAAYLEAEYLRKVRSSMMLAYEGFTPNIDKLANPDKVILFFGNSPTSDGMAPVGFADGHVETVRTADLPALLDRSREELKKTVAPVAPTTAPAGGAESF